MAGVYGVDEAKKVVKALAEFLSVGAKVIKGNIFAAIGLVGPVNVLKDVRWEEFKKEALELDKADRDLLEQEFGMHLDLPSNATEQKIVDFADALNEAAAVVEQAIKALVDAKVVFERFKNIVGA